MALNYASRLIQRARGLPNYLSRRVTPDDALRQIKHRLDAREKNFLNAARKLIYENPVSPYRKLLLWAGCEYRDLEESVTTHGIEKTLGRLRDQGVYVTLEEFKSLVPILRTGLSLNTHPSHFDNPVYWGPTLSGATSGSRSVSLRVMYLWDFLTEEAANESIFHETHGLSKVPLALWYPRTSFAGTHNLLLNVKWGKPPDRWFSHLGTEGMKTSLKVKNRLSIEFIRLCCRIYGLRVPRPELIDIHSAAKVARWMKSARESRGTSLVRTYTSSAVRIVRAAAEEGIDLSGTVMLTGGEPLTDSRLHFIESHGVKALTRYLATEVGLIGGSCPDREHGDDMHLYLDRLAVIQRTRKPVLGAAEVDCYLFTSISQYVPKVLFNTEMGDFGDLATRSCSCRFGELGMNLHAFRVRSYDKLTTEGMTLLGLELENVIGRLIEEAGGGPDDYQFWEAQNPDDISKLVIAVSPRIRNLDEGRFVDAVLERLFRNRNVTPRMWARADTLKVIRAEPEMSKGQKLLPIVRKPMTPGS